MYAVFGKSTTEFSSELSIYNAKYQKITSILVSDDDIENGLEVTKDKGYTIYSTHKSVLRDYTWVKIPNRPTLAKTLKDVVDPEIIFHLEYTTWLDRINRYGL